MFTHYKGFYGVGMVKLEIGLIMFSFLRELPFIDRKLIYKGKRMRILRKQKTRRNKTEIQNKEKENQKQETVETISFQ